MDSSHGLHLSQLCPFLYIFIFIYIFITYIPIHITYSSLVAISFGFMLQFRTMIWDFSYFCYVILWSYIFTCRQCLRPCYRLWNCCVSLSFNKILVFLIIASLTYRLLKYSRGFSRYNIAFNLQLNSGVVRGHLCNISILYLKKYYFICVREPECAHATGVGGQRTTFGSWLSLCTIWIVGIQLRSSGSVTNTFTHLAIFSVSSVTMNVGKLHVGCHMLSGKLGFSFWRILFY